MASLPFKCDLNINGRIISGGFGDLLGLNQYYVLTKYSNEEVIDLQIPSLPLTPGVPGVRLVQRRLPYEPFNFQSEIIIRNKENGMLQPLLCSSTKIEPLPNGYEYYGVIVRGTRIISSSKYYLLTVSGEKTIYFDITDEIKDAFPEVTFIDGHK